MTDGDALRRVILAEPDDDTPRLIYADWLEEHGDPNRADFIRVQIEHARLPRWDARQVRLQLHERELLAHYGARWRADLPDIHGVTWGEFRRGFIEPIARELPMEYALELNRLIELQMEGSVG